MAHSLLPQSKCPPLCPLHGDHCISLDCPNEVNHRKQKLHRLQLDDGSSAPMSYTTRSFGSDVMDSLPNISDAQDLQSASTERASPPRTSLLASTCQGHMPYDYPRLVAESPKTFRKVFRLTSDEAAIEIPSKPPAETVTAKVVPTVASDRTPLESRSKGLDTMAQIAAPPPALFEPNNNCHTDGEVKDDSTLEPEQVLALQIFLRTASSPHHTRATDPLSLSEAVEEEGKRNRKPWAAKGAWRDRKNWECTCGMQYTRRFVTFKKHLAICMHASAELLREHGVNSSVKPSPSGHTSLSSKLPLSPITFPEVPLVSPLPAAEIRCYLCSYRSDVFCDWDPACRLVCTPCQISRKPCRQYGSTKRRPQYSRCQNCAALGMSDKAPCDGLMPFDMRPCTICEDNGAICLPVAEAVGFYQLHQRFGLVI